MPRLSFIVPVYKTEKYLPRVIQHLVEQSFGDWEAVFVLDGPSDTARGMIPSGKDNRFKVVEIGHIGAPGARNEGFKHTSGEFVIFWDSDSYIEPEAAQNWVRIFDANPEYDFIYSGYRFENEAGVIESEPFDPWLLRVRNYISTMNPMRRKVFPGWNESLKSLQDWDMWLKIVSNGSKGLYQRGYAFSTELSGQESISGVGCAPSAWLDRVDAVKKLHGLPERDTCVSSLRDKAAGIALAKLIDADYQDIPNWKPHRYKNIIQIGFSLHPNTVEAHSAIFNQMEVNKFIFWTSLDLAEQWNAVSLSALDKYSILLNNVCAGQFCEDRESQKMLARAGFKAEIMPMPMRIDTEPKPYPAKPKFLACACEDYGQVFMSLIKSLPDIDIDFMDGPKRIDDYTGLIHMMTDRTMANPIKQAILSGRHVISNIKAPFTGYVDDLRTPDKFIPDMVEKIRKIAKLPANENAKAHYITEYKPDKLQAILGGVK